MDLIREAGKLIIDSGVKMLMIKAGKYGAYKRTGNVSSINNNSGISLYDKEWNNSEPDDAEHNGDKVRPAKYV
ncbi:MAG TPA: hypothetical protein DDW27_15765 [Bacteroidales bacterium]|nr:hypothetical protein [Bacteroidales bacterium]